MSRSEEKKKNSLHDAEEKLLRFRVAELQGFLQAMGLTKVGRKEDLRTRCLTFLHNAAQSGKLPQVCTRVDEFYYKRFPQLPLPPPVQRHASHYTSSTASQTSKVDVRLKALPFHEKIETVVRPRILPQVDARFHTNSQSITLGVAFTPMQQSQIQAGQRVVPNPYAPSGTEVKFTTEVLLRFAPCELSCEQADQYPPRCSVTVNSRALALPGYPLQRNGGQSERKTGQAVDITCLLVLGQHNSITITCAPSSDVMRKYVATVELCTKHTSSELLEKVKGNVRCADVCRAFIKEKLAGDADVEIATTSLRISLNCPLGKTRLVYPGRSTQCKHIQCFDVNTYLQMNELRARWMCPVCDREALFGNLLIDGLMEEVLAKCPPHVDHVEYFADGSWEPYQQRKGAKATSSSAASSSAESKVVASSAAGSATVCDLSASVTCLDGDGERSSPASPAAEEAERPGCHDVIDLTLDSDEDDSGDVVDFFVPGTPPARRSSSPTSGNVGDATTAAGGGGATAGASASGSGGTGGGGGGESSGVSYPAVSTGGNAGEKMPSDMDLDLDLLPESSALFSYPTTHAGMQLPPSLSSTLGTPGTGAAASASVNGGGGGGPSGMSSTTGASRPPSNMSAFSLPDLASVTNAWPDQSALHAPSHYEAIGWPFESIPGLSLSGGPGVPDLHGGSSASSRGTYSSFVGASDLTAQHQQQQQQQHQQQHQYSLGGSSSSSSRGAAYSGESAASSSLYPRYQPYPYHKSKQSAPGTPPYFPPHTRQSAASQRPHYSLR